MMRLAHVLEQYLWAQKITNKEFAETQGISASSLGRFLRGTHTLDSRHLATLLRWLLEEMDDTTR